MDTIAHGKGFTVICAGFLSVPLLALRLLIVRVQLPCAIRCTPEYGTPPALKQLNDAAVSGRWSAASSNCPVRAG
jgi:hypothetical protein